MACARIYQDKSPKISYLDLTTGFNEGATSPVDRVGNILNFRNSSGGGFRSILLRDSFHKSICKRTQVIAIDDYARPHCSTRPYQKFRRS